MIEQQVPERDHSLSFKNHYRHFLLLHDFLHKLTKIKAHNADFFDLQIEIHQDMRSAVNRGSKAAQLLSFGSLSLYFFKGHSIPLKFLSGFLFMYWFNHIMNLGTYAGAFFQIPSLYKKTSVYYYKHPEQLNLIQKLNNFMENSDTCEQPEMILPDMFEQKYEEKQFVANDYFVKNREKYFSKDMLEIPYESKKLKYFDSFLTRYIYYTFTRWLQKVKIVFTMESSDDD